MAADVAARRGVEERALTVRTLLHLPRIAGYGGLMPRRLVNAELVRAARRLAADVASTEHLVPREPFPLRDLRFAEISADQAEPIISALHYLRSARPDSVHYALLDPKEDRPVSLCSVSSLQWRRVTSQINGHFGIPGDRVRDVSRVFSCPTAPPNAISYLLARVRSSLRGQADLLTTAVDTNLGFTGASYRAANWQHWITVQPRPYLYHNEEYASPRQLRARFGTSAVTDLQERFPRERFEVSRAKLKQSIIFCWRVRGETEISKDPIPAIRR
jgi:hypothetical protein